MTTRLFALAALMLLPHASNAQVRDMHVFQNCPYTSYSACEKYQKVQERIGSDEDKEAALRTKITLAATAKSMRAEHLRWASSSATKEATEDMHLNQMCDNSEGLCYDVHHFDENQGLIKLRLENLALMKQMHDKGSGNQAAREFFKERVNTKIDGFEKDLIYLKKLHRASQMTTVKQDITKEIVKINTAIRVATEMSKDAPASGKAVR